MRLWALLCALFVMATSGAASKPDNPLIPYDKYFASDGRKVEEVMPIAGGEAIFVREEGVKGGWKYRFYHGDGSGSIAGDAENDLSVLRYHAKNWKVGCKKDPITDQVSCAASRDGFLVFYSKGTGFLSDVLGKTYPGSSKFVRVDNGEVFATQASDSFDNGTTKRILDSIQDGSAIVVRYADWPHKKNVDSVSKVYGASTVLEFLEWAVNVIE